MIQKLIGFFSKNQKYFTIGGACILLVLNSQQRTTITKLKQELVTSKSVDTSKLSLDSLLMINDSLQTELFQAQSQTGRYEMTLEYLKEIDPKRGEQFEEYLNNSTE